ncbi:MAG: beta-galactosidase [Chthonomonadales bacterium]|nr:beta-galactosidase [Chthonomonadales bacterium]
MRCLITMVAVLGAVAAGSHLRAEPLRLPDGEPLVAIYFFPHWWDPWKSSDEAVLADMRRLRAMGFNTLLLDHEWSQAIDGDWRLLDRSHRLAARAGLQIVPWLSLKTWSDVTAGDRARLARKWFGVDVRYGVGQDGKPAAPLVYDESVLRAGAGYTGMYLDRYAGGRILKLRWKGRERPVVSLSVESAWGGSFDDGTNAMFRHWLRRRDGALERLNARWGTRYASWAAVDPRDVAVFDYAGHVKGAARHPAAVEDHVAFRAEMLNRSLARMAREVRRAHPEVLFMAEIPYQYGSEHPHARAYRIDYAANPESCDYADIVLFRCTGPLSASEIETLAKHRRRTGQRFVLTYRTYSDWDVAADAPGFARSVSSYAEQAARHGDGFGFYSFNEMVDTHLAWSPGLGPEGWTRERSERAIGLAAAMVRRYRSLVGGSAHGR